MSRGGDARASMTAPSVVARPGIVVIGPTPPPYHGCSVATEYVLGAGLPADWTVHHLDTADRRGLENMGRLDLRNVVLALEHVTRMVVLLARQRPALVYVPIAQNNLGVLRDMGFMVPTLLAGRRLVVHVHGGGFGRFYDAAPAPLRALVRAVLGRARAVIILGEALRPTMRGLVPDERIRVIPNGMEDPFPQGVTREGARVLNVLYLGNLIRSKGFLDVLQAVAELVAAGVPLRLDLAGGWGSDDDRAAAAPLLAALGDRVHLHGPVGPAAKHDLLRAADVLAFPTYYEYEGHPFVVLEAMSAALPVVTTPHAALPETVLDGETGLIVAPRDVPALAAALRRLAEDRTLRQRLGAAGRARFLERYTALQWSRRLGQTLAEAR
jgi:glycosyltransferase involved in cell wall biosynthesis